MHRLVDHLKGNRIFYLAVRSTVAMLLYAGFILGHFSNCFSISGSANSLGLSLGYDIHLVQHFFEIRSKEQLICYGHFIRIWDSIFPILYTLMYALWFVYFFKDRRLLLIVPIMHMCSDWIENYVELLMLEQYLSSNTLSDSLVSFGSAITLIKWSLSVITYSIILFGIVTKLRILLTKPRSH